MSKLLEDFNAYSFQRLCKDILKIEFNTEFSEFGRNGQKQEGIDLISLPPYSIIKQKVAQCKFYDKKSYSKFLKQIKKDYATACNCEDFEFDDFIVLTSLYRDKETQIELINNVAVTDHPIKVYFWDDIELIATKHLSILKIHFSYLMNSNDMDLFEKEQKKYMDVIKALFYHYNMWGIVHIPSMERAFDDILFYKFDECVEKYNIISEKFRNSDYYISSELTDNVHWLFYMLDSFYSFLAHHCRRSDDGKAIPDYISEDLLKLFNDNHQKICSQYDLVYRMIR